MCRRALLACLAALLAACAGAPPTPPPPPEPQAPPAPAPLQPPNTAAMPPVSAAAPRSLPSRTPPRPAPAAPVQDTVPLTQIQAAFDLQKRYFWKLYTAHLQSRPGLKGRMLVSFTINPDGSARDARLVDSDLGEPDLEQDVLREIVAMTFPTARLPTPVQNYPLVFSSSKAPRK